MRNILISAFAAAAVLGVAGTASAQQIQVNFGPNPGYVPPVAVQLKPWGVQLSAGFSRERVLVAYAVIATRYATLLADKDTTIVSSLYAAAVPRLSTKFASAPTRLKVQMTCVRKFGARGALAWCYAIN
jgi:hypothetical protein